MPDGSRETTGFAAELDALAARVRAEVGDDDVAYMRRVIAISNACGFAGRVLIALSPGPITFATGVCVLAVHDVLEVGEIGHTVLHGVYDELDPKLRGESHRWEFPIDEAAWRYGHNLRHHRYTGITGKDADVAFGFLRLTEDAPHRWLSYLQLPATMLGALPFFGLLGQMHFSGMYDVLMGNGLASRFDFIEDRTPKTLLRTISRALRKPLRYYGKSYVLYPVLAGPFAPKLVLGTFIAERIRDVWAGVTILCGHTGQEVACFPEGTRAHGKDEYYRMQVEATNDFDVPWLLSILCGGLDRQIEHHLFPDLPPNRTRAIADEVRAICEKHGVRYRRESLPRTAWKMLAHIARLSVPTAQERGTVRMAKTDASPTNGPSRYVVPSASE